jgi:hypothetical protein
MSARSSGTNEIGAVVDRPYSTDSPQILEVQSKRELDLTIRSDADLIRNR